MPRYHLSNYIIAGTIYEYSALRRTQTLPVSFQHPPGDL